MDMLYCFSRNPHLLTFFQPGVANEIVDFIDDSTKIIENSTDVPN